MHRRVSGDDNILNLIDANGSKLSVDLAHVGEYDTALLGLLLSQPAAVLPAFELAAEDALKSLLYDLRSSNDASESDTMQGPDAAATDPNAPGTETQEQREQRLGWHYSRSNSAKGKLGSDTSPKHQGRTHESSHQVSWNCHFHISSKITCDAVARSLFSMSQYTNHSRHGRTLRQCLSSPSLCRRRFSTMWSISLFGRSR